MALLRSALILAFVIVAVRAADLETLETYILAEDHEQALELFVPGSDEWYYQRALLLQQRGELDAVDGLVQRWQQEQRHSRSRRIIENRQDFLRAGDDPDAIRQRLRRFIDLPDDPRARQEREAALPSDLQEAWGGVDDVIGHELRQGHSVAGPALRHAIVGRLVPDLMLYQQAAQDPQRWPRLFDLLESGDARDARWARLAAFCTIDELQRLRPRHAQARSAIDNLLVGKHIAAVDPWDELDTEARLQLLQDIQPYAQHDPRTRLQIAYHRLHALWALGRLDGQAVLGYLQQPRPVRHIELPRAEQRRIVSFPWQGCALPPVRSDHDLLDDVLFVAFRDDLLQPQQVASLIGDDHARELHAEAKATSGQGDPATWARILGEQKWQALRDRRELRWLPGNPRRLDAGDALQMHLRTKNPGMLELRVYRLAGTDVRRVHGAGLPQDIDLDGLVPTARRSLDTDADAMLRRDRTVDVPEVDDRGLWVVEVVAAEERLRSVLQVGTLHGVVTPDVAGNRVQVVRPDGEPVPRAQVWLAERRFLTDDQGAVVLPFVEEDVDQRRQLIIADGPAAMIVEVPLFGEDYDLRLDILADATQLRGGTTTMIPACAHLSLHGRRLPVGLIEDLRWQVTTVDVRGEASTITVQPDARGESRWVDVPVVIPRGVQRVTVQVAGSLRPVTADQSVALDADATLTADGFDRRSGEQLRTRPKGSAYLRRAGADWIIDLLGRDGEPLSGVVVHADLGFDVLSGEHRVSVRSDQQGRIRIGEMPHLHSITVAFDDRRQVLELPRERVTVPDLVLTADEPLQVPTVHAAGWELVRLSRQGSVLGTLAGLSVDRGAIAIAPLAAGRYELRHESGVSHRITVLDGSAATEAAAVITADRLMAYRVPVAVSWEQATIAADTVTLHVGGDQRARIHVLATRYSAPGQWPAGPTRPELAGYQRQHDFSAWLGPVAVGSELRYIAHRQSQSTWFGSLLDRPGLLLNPWQVGESEWLPYGDRGWEAFGSGGGANGAFGQRSSGGKRRSDTARPTYAFLAGPVLVAADLQPDESGHISIARSALGDASMIHVVIDDGVARQERLVGLPATPLQRRSRVPTELLPEDQVRDQQWRWLAAGETMRLPADRRVAVLTDVGDLLDFYARIGGMGLGPFAVLGQWHAYDDAIKREHYRRLASHELHLFLWRHDPDFFQAVVHPILAAKLQPDVIDRVLLGEVPVSDAAWARANPAELALLALALPEVRAAVARRLRETAVLAVDDDQRADLQRQRLRRVLQAAAAADQAVEAQARRRSEQQELDDADKSDRRSLSNAMEESTLSADGVAPPASAAAGAMTSFPGPEVVIERRELAREARFYRQLGPVAIWAEQQWFGVRRTQDRHHPQLPADPVWARLAGQGDEGVQSAALADLFGGRAAAIVAASFSGLPLHHDGRGDAIQDQERVIGGDTPMLVAVEIAEQVAEAQEEILVRRRYARWTPGRDASEDGSWRPVSADALVAGTVYQAEVVLVNSTDQAQQIDLLRQLPLGSLYLGSAAEVDGYPIERLSMQLDPYEVRPYRYRFYVPRAGDYQHAAELVQRDARLIGRGESQDLIVLAEAPPDPESWAWISQQAPLDRCLDWLQERNLQGLALADCAWRGRDEQAYRALVELFENAGAYVHDLWAFSLQHRDWPRLRRYLSQELDEGELGPAFASAMVTIDPVVRDHFERLDYAPLIPGRVHDYDGQRIKAAHQRETYHAYLQILAHRAITGSDRMALACDLIDQERIGAAIDQMQKVDRDTVNEQLQYDYIDAYLALRVGDPERARAIANTHAEHPALHWRERFQAVIATCDDTGSDGTRGGELVQQAAADASLSVRAVDRSLHLRSTGVDTIEVACYPMDLEVLFSRAPFLAGSSIDGVTLVAPAVTVEHAVAELDVQDGEHVVPLPEAMAAQDLVAVVSGGGVQDQALILGGTVDALISQQQGIVRVVDSSGEALGKAYCKVYVRLDNGEVRYHKDGYSDINGRFDYVSVSGPTMDGVERLALLVLHPEAGAAVREMAPPAR